MPHAYPPLNVQVRTPELVLVGASDDIQLTGVEACLPVLGLDRHPVSRGDETP
jgi:hypothetical protein